MTVEGLDSPRYASVKGSSPVRPVVGRCEVHPKSSAPAIGCMPDDSGTCIYCGEVVE